eukprot:scpid108723/ scgid18702/ 
MHTQVLCPYMYHTQPASHLAQLHSCLYSVAPWSTQPARVPLLNSDTQNHAYPEPEGIPQIPYVQHQAKAEQSGICHASVIRSLLGDLEKGASRITATHTTQ